MSNRKKLSGAEYRKKAHERLRNESEILEKMPKLDNYFQKKNVTPEASKSDLDSESELRCIDTTEQQLQQSVAATIDSAADDVKSENFGDFSVENIEVLVNKDDSGPLETTETMTTTTTLNKLRPIYASNVVMTTLISDDPATWVINHTTRDIILRRGFKQNSDADFTLTKRQYPDRARYMSESLFNRTLANGQSQPRSWLVYSPSILAVFCAPCRLFGMTSTLATKGWGDWKNVHHCLKQHENSFEHKSATTSLLERSRTKGAIDKVLLTEMEKEINYWQKVLSRVVAVIKSLARSGLAFRGSIERFHSASSGNYIAALELIAEFDPFLAEHIKLRGNKGRGSTSYLSSTTCDELIGLMGKLVTTEIISETKASKYFSISVDSTPDISHVDQLTFIIRYVSKEGLPEEHFIKFIPNTGHKAAEMITHVLCTFEEYGLDIQDCRGQSYDNASNMSGIYSGLQARIKQINHLAEYVPCAAHTLNLVGKCAVESCPTAVRFFAVLQHLYTFFSASTHRWEILSNHLDGTCPVVKSLSQTRWSAHSDACKSLCKSWDEILDALTAICDNDEEKADTRAEATGLFNSLNTLENCFIAIVWNDILNRFHGVSRVLQKVDIELASVVELYKSLVEYVRSLRDEFDVYERKAKEKCGINDYTRDTTRLRRRRARFEENRENEQSFCGRENLKVNTFYFIVDRLLVELTSRSQSYIGLCERFHFLTQLATMDKHNIALKARDLQSHYAGDLEDSLGIECEHFGAHLRSLEIKSISALQLCAMLFEKNLGPVYPNIDVALRILLSMAATNCSAERSFSVLRRVKNYLRSTISQERLNALATLCIESEKTENIDFDTLIREFARAKCRRGQSH